MDPRDYALTVQNLLFQGVDFTTVEYMLERCSVRNLDANEKLLQPDIPNQHLYLILAGKLSVHLGAQETMAHASLIAGECAGEISIVDGKHPSALVVASAIGVLAGSLLAEYINTKYLHYIAGIGFIGIGIFTLYNA